MADRTSAEIFAYIFDYLVHNDEIDFDHKEFVEWLWKLSQQYDFCWQQMEIDEDLEKLGLIKSSKE